MLTIRTFTNNPLQENTYVVHDETNEAVIIDCGAMLKTEKEAIRVYIEECGLRVVKLLLTHGHFDHIFGAQWVADTYSVKPELHAADAELYLKGSRQLLEMYGTHYKFEVPAIGHQFVGEDVVSFGNHRFCVIPTPGHTPGGCCYHCADENVIFTGDSLFAGSIGRTDFPGGSTRDLIEALTAKILTLPGKTIVYPGHGETSTIHHEQTCNPYL